MVLLKRDDTMTEAANIKLDAIATKIKSPNSKLAGTLEI